MLASEKTQVEVSFERDGHAYVAAATGTLKEGDQVVTEGNERLQPGQPLMIRTAAPVKDPNTAESP